MDFLQALAEVYQQAPEEDFLRDLVGVYRQAPEEAFLQDLVEDFQRVQVGVCPLVPRRTIAIYRQEKFILSI